MDDLTARIECSEQAVAALRVLRLDAMEAISVLPTALLEVVAEGHDPPEVEDLVGTALCVVLETDGRERRRFWGVVTSATRGATTRASEDAPEQTPYSLDLEPSAAALRLVTTQELFLDATLPALFRDKLANVGMEEGADFELRLGGGSAARELIVQYKETDLAFLSRLAEHAGVSFYVEPGAEGERLVVTDQTGGFTKPDAPELHHRPAGEKRELFQLDERAQAVPRAFGVQDYNYRSPLVDVVASVKLEGGLGGGTLEYGAHAKSQEEARAIAQLRAEAAEATRVVFSGRSAVPELYAGCRRVLSGHPRHDGLELLVTEVHHRATFAQGTAGGAGSAEYQNELKAVRTKTTYRPPLRTPRPRVHGFLTGVIQPDVGGDGTIGKNARMDDQGRYYVSFHFDTAEPGRPRASRPIRLAQQQVGDGYGTHFPLRPGVEVLVAFADGDPDRPVILGAVPNPTAPSVVDARSGNRARIKTASGALIEFGDD